MIDLSRLNIDYYPYPIGIASNIFDPSLYQRMLDNFPDIKHFSTMRGAKYSFNGRDKAFWDFVNTNPVWSEFNDYMNSAEFVHSVFETLKQKNIDLGINDYKHLKRGEKSSRLANAYRALKGGKTPVEIETKFEFSALHANGGSIWPHTDSKQKIVTLVMSMAGENEWDTQWGGGTSAVTLKQGDKVFDRTNTYKPDFKDVEVLKTYEFKENQCLLFVKTFNSWHAVMPMHNPNIDTLRKSLTINIIQK